MRLQRWLFLLVPALIVPFLIWAYDQMNRIYAIGSIDLGIEYHIVDAATGHGIPEARVDFREDEGRPTSRGFIVADTLGLARHDFPDSTISTQSSGLHWTVHEAVYLPSWSYSVSAPGYIPSNWRGLNDYRLETKITGNRRAILTILVELEQQK